MTKKYGIKELVRDYGSITFAKLLHTYRLTQELNQNELGKKLGGLSAKTVCDYEKGYHIPTPTPTPTPTQAEKIAKRIGEIPSYWIQTAVQDYIRQHKKNELAGDKSRGVYLFF